MADINTEVDARPADKMRTGVSPLENTGTGRLESRQRVIMRGVARVLRLLLGWLAMGVSFLGWLVQASFRWIVVIPSLNARLAHQYRKTGEQAYRNPNGEDQGGMIREQIRAIDSEAERVGSGAERGASNGMSKSHSRVALLAARMMRWHKKRRLLALLGKELVGRETANEESCRFVKQARSTLETIRRTKARRPVKCGAGNIGVGLATLLVIACAWHLGRNASGVADTGEAPAMAYDIFTGEWFPVNNNRDKSDAVGAIHSAQDTISLREYVSNAYTRVTSVPENALDAQWYRYGIDRGVLCAGMRLGAQKIIAERPFDDNGMAIYLIRLSTCDWVADETDSLIKQGYYPDIRGYETASTEAKAISSLKFDSFIRGMIDGLEARKPNLLTYGLSPPKE